MFFNQSNGDWKTSRKEIMPRIHVFNLPKSRRQSLLGIPRDCEDHMPGPPAKKKVQALRPVRPCNRNQNHREDLEISSYVMGTLWICYGYSNPYVFLTSLPFAFWKIWKKNNCQARGVVSCIVQDLVQFHLDIPQSHRLQASREPIAMCANRPWFCAVLRIKYMGGSWNGGTPTVDGRNPAPLSKAYTWNLALLS